MKSTKREEWKIKKFGNPNYYLKELLNIYVKLFKYKNKLYNCMIIAKKAYKKSKKWTV